MDECSSTEEEVLKKSLLHFINSFGNQIITTCISCNNDLVTNSCFGFESSISKRVLREICIKSIVPDDVNLIDQNQSHHNLEEEEDLLLPFCQECTDLVSNLTDLYRQFKAIEEQFNKARGQIVHGIIKSYLKVETASISHDESDIFSRWQTSMRISSNRAKDTDFEVKPELVDVKIEADDDEDEEPEEFIMPEELLPEFQPYIPIERLDIEGNKTPAESLNGGSEDENNYSYYCADENDSKSEDSEEEEEEEKESEDEKSMLNQIEIQEVEAQEEYVPPYDINIPKCGVMTRTRAKAKSAASNQSSHKKSSVDVEAIATDSDVDFASSDSEAEEPIVVVRTKRKYTTRGTGRIAKKKLNQKAKLETSSINKEVEDSGEPKPKKKRIRKRYPPVQCKVCKKMISNGGNLKIHMRIHTGDRPFKCSECSMSFYKSSNLTAHMFKHTKIQAFACDLCESRFSIRATLRNHKYYVHNVFEGKVLFECKFCLKLFLLQSNLTDHSNRIHSTDSDSNIVRNIRCTFCEINFKSIAELSEHVNTEEHAVGKSQKVEQEKQVEPSKEIRVTLLPDEAEFTELKPKRRKKDAKGPPRVVGERLCEDCGEKFPNRTAWMKHQKKYHPSKKFQCEICGNHFSEQGNLRKHVRAHSMGKNFICHFCGKNFKHHISLKFHLTKHTGDWLYKCEHCPSGFHKDRELRRHLNQVHPEIHLKGNTFICRCCYMNFESDEALVDHMQCHDHLKCEYCGKYFGVKFKLIKHLRIHTGERPHKCSFCSKTFTQECNLQEHEHRHKGTRPHRCSFCDAGFLRKKEMQKHIEKNHPNAEDNASQSPPPPQVNDFNVSESFPTLQLADLS